MARRMHDGILLSAILAMALAASVRSLPISSPGGAGSRGGGGGEAGGGGGGDDVGNGDWSSEGVKAKAEKLFLSIPSADSARESLKSITAYDHLAGTEGCRKAAIYVHRRLSAALAAPGAGTQIEMHTPETLLQYPISRSVTMLSPTVYEAPLSEAALPGDSTSDTPWRNLTFNAYSANGDVTAEAVYANFGTPDDFDALDKAGVSVKGKVVIVRYGVCFRGLKVMNAQARGAAAVIIYSDPAEDGFENGPVYPEGPYRPKDGVQRGSAQFASLCAGDPARIYSSKTTLELCGYTTEDLLPKIPVLPMSWGDAQPILQQLAGPPPPDGFKGAIPDVPYSVGPGPAVVRVAVESEMKVRSIWNVVATIPGKDYGTPDDRMVVLGNHRDAWVFGASDPNSGTAALIEVARGIGALLKRGWRPRRTIKICSWDAEEYGLIGSTAWGETFEAELSSKAIAYINMDVAVAGQELVVGASPLLAPLVRDVTSVLEDPSTGKTLLEVWGGNARTLGTGSDYTVFLDRLGIPCIDLSFKEAHTNAGGGASYGLYHSVYDSFSWIDAFGDPGFLYHRVAAKLWGLVTIRLADSIVVPMSPTSLGSALSGYVADVEKMKRGDAGVCAGQCGALKSGGGASVDFAKLDKAVKSFGRTANSTLLAKAMADCGTKSQSKRTKLCPDALLKNLNDAIAFTERGFIDQAGLPGRRWFRHVLQAPGLYLGYGADSFPGIAQALRDGDWELAQSQVTVCSSRVKVAERKLAGWGGGVKGGGWGGGWTILDVGERVGEGEEGGGAGGEGGGEGEAQGWTSLKVVVGEERI